MKFRPPRGTRDIFGKDAEKRRFIKDTIASSFRLHGFLPVETPAFEDFALLTEKSGEAVRDEIYYFKDKSDRELGLRFEFTASVCRLIASNPELQKPVKTCQIGKVWRYDRPQAGRYREFTQADIDIFGSDNVEADFDCVSTAVDCLTSLGIKGFTIRANSSKILEDAAIKNGVPKERISDFFRSLDKLEKIGKENVAAELKDKGIKCGIDFISDVKISGTELESLLKLCKSAGISKYVKHDPSLVRGLDYYTGNVFEIKVEGLGVSCGGGGRYDNLVEALGGRPTPAVGISLGVDRLESAVPDFPERPKVFVANVSEKEYGESLKTASSLREEGITAEAELMGRKLSKQLEYASSAGFNFCIIVGERELKRGRVVLKDMKNKSETEISLEKIKENIKKKQRS